MILTETFKKNAREDFFATWPGLVDAFESAEEMAYFLAYQDALIDQTVAACAEAREAGRDEILGIVRKAKEFVPNENNPVSKMARDFADAILSEAARHAEGDSK